MSFKDVFKETTLSDRPALVEAERDRRVKDFPDDYVAIPICIPVQSQVAPGQVADYQLGWMLGMPGSIEHPEKPGKQVREGFPIPAIGREDTMEDLAYLLNVARKDRTTKENCAAPSDADTQKVG